MHYAKQKDGRSWLFYEKTDSGKRRIAVAALDPHKKEPAFDIERIDCSDEDFQEVRRLCERISNVLKKADRNILIICEGQTEELYFRELRNALKIEKKVDVVNVGGGDPGTHFQEAAKKMLWERATGTETYGEYWLVFDRDGHAGFHEAYQQKQFFPNIHLAFTNPCFEYWAAMHHPSFDGVLPLTVEKELDSEETVEELTPSRKRVVTVKTIELCASPELCFDICAGYFPGYKKNSSGYLRLFGKGIKHAYGRMRAMESPRTGLGSDIPDLLDRLFKLAGKTPEEGIRHLIAFCGGAVDDDPKTAQEKAAKRYASASAVCARILALKNLILTDKTAETAKHLHVEMASFQAYVRSEILRNAEAKKKFPALETSTLKLIRAIEEADSADALKVNFENSFTSLCDIAQIFVQHNNYKFQYNKRLLANNCIAICQAWLLKVIDAAEKSQMPAPAEPVLTSEEEEMSAPLP